MIASGGWIARRQGYDFLSDVVHVHGCQELGFTAYESLRLADLGPLWTAMRSTVTLKESLDVFCRLAARTYEGNEFWVSTAGDQAWLCGRTTSRLVDVHPCTRHLGLMVLFKAIQANAGPQWSPSAICLQAPETGGLQSISGLASCPVEFNESYTGVAFPRVLLSRPMSARRVYAPGRSDSRYPAETLPSAKESFSESLARLLSSRLVCAARPNLDEVAEIVDLSQRTVRRRLYDEGTNYREILDRVRFATACEMLRGDNETVAQIAFQLGYSGANNFVRSFKRLAGMTPIEFRDA